MKDYLKMALAIWLAIAVVALITGTIGGVHDNIQYRDWLSVALWAVFGPAGAALAAAGFVHILSPSK